MKHPIVYLVGSGPGDPLLISVRGLKYLKTANVVVFDHLVHAKLLRSVSANAECIDVGPSAHKSFDQEAISYLLADKAREGNVVVRLKLGDPFVFNDGGKEALFLHEQGIPFEVVPGIPSAIGTPCYAGIPITYPGDSNITTFVRGDASEGSQTLQVDWKNLARLSGTIVCYVNTRQLPIIVRSLLKNGRPPDEPTALIYEGSLPQQQTLKSTLGDIIKIADRKKHKRQAILIVGWVASLRDHLRWFDTRPLFGKRILITRSREQAGELVELLEKLGAETIESPCIRIEPPNDIGPLQKICKDINTLDWIVFTSINGVEKFMQCLLDSTSDVRVLHGVQLCAVGPTTAKRLAHYGLEADLVPSEHHSEGVAEALRAATNLSGKRILLPRSEIASKRLPRELEKSGAKVISIAAYRTVSETDLGKTSGHDVYRMLLNKSIDVVTFTSASTVQNFVKSLGAEQTSDLLAATLVASIGPVTADAAKQLDIQTSIMPSVYTVPALVQEIVNHFNHQPKTI